MNNTTANAGNYYDLLLSRFTSHWYNVWMTGNVACETIAIPMGFLNFFCIITGMSLVKEGVAKSARVYYMTLALLDILPISGYHFLLSYMDEDFRYLSGNTVFVMIEAIDGWCKYSFVSLHFAEHVANWLYVVLCVERLFVVHYPLKARGFFSKKLALQIVAIIVLTALPTVCLASMTYGPYYYPDFQRTYCITLPTAASFAILFPVYCAITIYTMPIAITIVVSLLLTRTVIAHARKRQRLTSASKTDSSSGAGAAGLNGAITVLMMSTAHCTIYVPSTTLLVWSRIVLLENSNPYLNVSVNYACWLFLNLSAFAHCQNLIIYTLRIPSFRKVLFCRDQRCPCERR